MKEEESSEPCAIRRGKGERGLKGQDAKKGKMVRTVCFKARSSEPLEPLSEPQRSSPLRVAAALFWFSSGMPF